MSSLYAATARTKNSKPNSELKKKLQSLKSKDVKKKISAVQYFSHNTHFLLDDDSYVAALMECLKKATVSNQC